ncbi:MAG TPA: hypothetical protein VK610_09990, partial [Rhodothermales bacterium]|nr:hypothetical protein [Rhodothermales bacterium]
FGSNPFYHEFGAAFTPPPGPFRVTGADVYVAHVAPTPAVDAYTLRVYGGSLETGPDGAPLYSEVRTLSSTLPSLFPPVATPLSFGPVDVEGTFFITLASADGLDVEDWSIGATQDLNEPNPYTWFFYGERWFRLDSLIGDETNKLEVFLWLDARGEAGTSAAEPGAGAAAGLVRAFTAAPNPLGAAGSVAFELAAAARVRVAAYDVLGREVAVLADGPYPAGRSRVGWDAAALPSGLYVVRLVADGERRAVRVVRR